MGEMAAEDYESIDRASRELYAQGWRKAFTLNEMFDAWASLVAEVERGYDQMVDEYTNDMACRDWLSLVWPMLTDRVRDARAEELKVLDARFKTATEDDGGSAIGRFYRVENKDGWWWRRRPIKAAGVFAADLAAE
ncbi:hypothetical protein ABFU82_05280 [Nocardioides sp. WV_118_6]|uniref:hypothetical protein n=1 Tax=Nocardioides simplex TaxID=2045 RepID=UPI00214FC04D|nr:hypothetical protein [Pimelobacter simplex]UUW87826.1 hypothetical protein M0M43_19015 [Pimelobacter simplex]UUW97331.1 hypothetical protein M0M48_07665 [Pimelobacter simplex]